MYLHTGFNHQQNVTTKKSKLRVASGSGRAAFYDADLDEEAAAPSAGSAYPLYERQCEAFFDPGTILTKSDRRSKPLGNVFHKCI